MSINGIYDSYNKLISSIKSKLATPTVGNNTSSNTVNTDNKTPTDKLELGSDLSELSGYLNYNASGNYNLPSLADYLNTGESNSLIDLLGNEENTQFGLADLLGSEESTQMSLADLLESNSSSGSDNSTDGMFNTLIQQKTAYTDFLIQQAISRISTSGQSTEKDKTESVSPDNTVEPK